MKSREWSQYSDVTVSVLPLSSPDLLYVICYGSDIKLSSSNSNSVTIFFIFGGGVTIPNLNIPPKKLNPELSLLDHFYSSSLQKSLSRILPVR